MIFVQWCMLEMDDIKLELSASPNTVWSIECPTKFQKLNWITFIYSRTSQGFWYASVIMNIYEGNISYKLSHLDDAVQREKLHFHNRFPIWVVVKNYYSSEKNNWEKHHCTIILLLFWILLNESELYKKSNHRADCHHLCKIMTEPRFYSQLFILGVYYLLSYNGNQLILRLKWGRNIFFA